MTGWRLTAAEFWALPFADFSVMADAAMRERRREAQELRLNCAFNAWLQGAGGDKSWGRFCDYYGLTSDKNAVSVKADGATSKTQEDLYKKAALIVAGLSN